MHPETADANTIFETLMQGIKADPKPESEVESSSNEGKEVKPVVPIINVGTTARYLCELEGWKEGEMGNVDMMSNLSKAGLFLKGFLILEQFFIINIALLF